mgnify:CR=1 FL=1
MTKKIRDKRGKEFSLQVIPFAEVEDLSISERVKKILDLILSNKIIILHGRLRAEEEARLIEDTMALVDHMEQFKGIELAVIEPDMRKKGFFEKMKHGLAKSLVGDTSALTIIGPAAVIKDIKKDPKKIELFFS